MDAIKINKDSKIVDVLVAQAKGERVDSAVAENAAKLINDLVSDMNPHNRYQIAQLVGFAVNEINKPKLNWLDTVADTKRVGFGDKAQFKTKLEGVRAFIQAKGATTARSKIAHKTVTLDTLAVSARPVLNTVEMKAGQTSMSDLILDASYQMELAQLGYIYKVLTEAYSNMASPYYGAGDGIVPETLNPMIRHWARVQGGAGAAVLGDIDVISKLGEQTGFKAAADSKQFADDLILEQNRNGYVGVYNSAKVIQLVNPMIEGTDTPVLETNKLFILPTAIDTSMRPLKVVLEGDVQSIDTTNIDDLSYEIRLDQYFGAGVVYGDRPYMSVYEDTAV